MSRIADVRKIAVLRANGIGDFVFALPALDALRLAYPEAEISLLGLPWHARFLESRPGPVDRVIVIPPCLPVYDERETRAGAQEMQDFFESMQRERFDLALQLHGGGRHSNPFTLRLGARVSAGLRAADAAPLERNLPYVYYQREVIRYLEAVALVGAAANGHSPRLETTESDVDEARRSVPELDGARDLAVICPGAGDGRRRWPAERFGRVADALADGGARIVLTGSAGEQPLAGAVREAMHHPALDLCGELSLSGLTGLLSRAALFVGNDSGPFHVAMAAGTPAVGVYWCGNLITAGPMSSTLARPLVSFRRQCPECGTDCISDQCRHDPSFVDEVCVDDVADAAFELWRGGN